MIQKETETAEIANTKKVKCSYKFENNLIITEQKMYSWQLIIFNIPGWETSVNVPKVSES